MMDKTPEARSVRPVGGVSLFGTGAKHRPTAIDFLGASARAALVASDNLAMFTPSRVWNT